MQRFSLNVFAAVAMAAVLASTVNAQEGGRRGRGGFGGGGFGLGGLVAMPEVQKEIGLSEADATKLNEAIRALRPEGGGGNVRNQSQEERDKRMAAFREAGKKIDDKIKSSLTDAQFKRLGELRIQREGVGALERSEVADKLNLTTEQKEKIKSISEAARPQFARGGNNGGGNTTGERPNFEEMRAKREKANADILAVLTPEQKTAFDNMKGAKFEFPQRGPGGRGQRPAAE